MNHSIRCSCGAFQGELSQSGPHNRLICYCKDCQSFAYFLQRQGEILDACGGSEIVQTLPKNVTFTQGQENVACMRLTGKGLLRWYARCCNTPIGNTLANPQLSFVGLVHSCLDQDGMSLAVAFGPVRALAFTDSATCGNIRQKGMITTITRTTAMLLKARLDGSYRETPFFKPGTAVPVVEPIVLSSDERAQLRRAL